MGVERLDFAKRQGGEPLTVRVVRQGQANTATPYFGKGSRYFRKARGGLAETRA